MILYNCPKGQGNKIKHQKTRGNTTRHLDNLIDFTLILASYILFAYNKYKGIRDVNI